MSGAILHARIRTATGASLLSEFGAAFVLFAIILLVPFINLCYTFGVCSLAWFSVYQSASLAGDASTYGEALSLVRAQAHKFVETPMLKELKLMTDEKTDVLLYILDYGQKQGVPKEFGPNKPLDKSIDTSQNIYDYSVRVTVHVPPLLGLSAVPFLAEIPIWANALTLLVAAIASWNIQPGCPTASLDKKLILNRSVS